MREYCYTVNNDNDGDQQQEGNPDHNSDMDDENKASGDPAVSAVGDDPAAKDRSDDINRNDDDNGSDSGSQLSRVLEHFTAPIRNNGDNGISDDAKKKDTDIKDLTSHVDNE